MCDMPCIWAKRKKEEEEGKKKLIAKKKKEKKWKELNLIESFKVNDWIYELFCN